MLRRITLETIEDGIKKRNSKLANPAKLLSYHQKTDVCPRMMGEGKSSGWFTSFDISLGLPFMLVPIDNEKGESTIE